MAIVLVASSGDWVAASFTPAVLPSAANDVIIPTGVTITLTAPTAIYCKSITLQGTASVVVPTAANGSTVHVTDRVYLQGTGGIVGGTAVTPAEATSTLTNGAVSSVTLTTGGTAYVTAPQVYASPSPTGNTAILNAVIANGVVTSVQVINGGSYTSPPTISFIGGNAIVTVTQERFNEMSTATTFQPM